MKRWAVIIGAIVLTGCASNSKYISAKDFNEPYPFTVDGFLECDSAKAIVLKANGNIYPINGTAKTRYQTLAKPLDEIWKDNPSIPGTKISVGEVISAGQKLCQ